MKTVRRRYRITALSPVHVGSGRALVRDVDFLEEEGKTLLLDTTRLAELLALAPGTLDDYAWGRIDTRQVLERMRVRPERIARLTHATRADSARILELCRDGADRPMLPGSALKGALRTLVVWALSFDFDEKTRDWQPSKEAARAMKAALSGGDHSYSPENEHPAGTVERALMLPPVVRMHGVPAAGRDLMRYLGVGDCTFKDADLDLSRARILTATPEGPGFKADGLDQKPRARADDPSAASLGVETLRVGSQGEASLRFDGLFELLRTPLEKVEKSHKRIFDAARGEIDFEPWRLDVPAQVAIHSRNLGLALCHRERRFYEERKLFELAKFYAGLEQQLQKAAGTEAIFARVGWGGGWEAMTGGLPTGEAREEVKRRYNLGRPGYVFPKSRKLALDGPKAARPFGWIRLDPLPARAPT